MPSEVASKIIDNTIAGVENLYGTEFPKRAGYIISYGDQIDEAIAMAVAAEREACAAVADEHHEFSPCGQCTGLTDPGTCAETIASLIRDRSNTSK